ncbi:MAG: hypothetical protein ACU841_15165 [Gammaproteobacteria bacterium]
MPLPKLQKLPKQTKVRFNASAQFISKGNTQAALFMEEGCFVQLIDTDQQQASLLRIDATSSKNTKNRMFGLGKLHPTIVQTRDRMRCSSLFTMKVAKRRLKLPRPPGEGTIRQLAISLAGVASKRHARQAAAANPNDFVSTLNSHNNNKRARQCRLT